MTLSTQLDQRRASLRLSKAQLARKADLSLPTVNRVLSGRDPNPRLGTLTSIATALGVEIHVGESPRLHELADVQAFREAQARIKAVALVRLVQGSMALEAEAVSSEVIQELIEQNVRALISGPARRLWEDWA